tara:strand:+ start:4338 stop:5129 length:792 start_codon:yes stop_codon:yes gene_type:complete
MIHNWKEGYGEWALVTGASSGIGKEFCYQLANRGMNIILVARRKTLIEEIASDIELKNGVKTITIDLDITEDSSIDKIYDKLKNIEVGFLVNNAGIGSFGDFHQTELIKYQNMIKLNCMVPVILTFKFLEKMLNRKKGAIIFLSSKSAYQPTPFFSVYGATKVFNLFLGEALWAEYKKNGIDIMSLSPGLVNTGFQKNAGVTPNQKGLMWANPKEVVSTALNSIGIKSSVVHGKLDKFLAFLIRLSPRKLSIKVAGMVAKSQS